jgi:hypothetical protein
MTTEDKTKVDKRVYTKPQVTEVRLVAGETVLANCKNNNGFDACQGIDITCFPASSLSS